MFVGENCLASLVRSFKQAVERIACCSDSGVQQFTGRELTVCRKAAEALEVSSPVKNDLLGGEPFEEAGGASSGLLNAVFSQ